jgi:OPA family glycerol-3-phosphate transporter-like MFS transporter
LTAAGAGEPPSAFRRAQWRVLLATSFCYLFYYTGRQNFGWAIPGIRTDLRLTNTEIGWISGLGLTLYGVGQVVSGRMGDRVGGRQMVALGALLSCLLNWVTSFGRGFWTLVVPWALNGYAQSMGFAPGSRLIVNWWGSRERGRAFAVFTFAAGLSSVVTVAAAILVLERFSWEWIFRLPVLLLPAAAAVFFGLVRDRPEDAGFPGAAEARPLRDDGPPAARPAPGGSFGTVLRSRRFLIACAGFGLNNWARLGLLGWAPVHFLGADWRANPAAGWVTVALPVGMAFGALAAGAAVERVFRGHHARLIAAFLVVAASATGSMFFVPAGSPWLGPALLFVGGFFLFGPFTSFTALCPEILGPELVGTGIGVMNAVGYGAAALGDPLIGLVLDVTGVTGSIFLVTAGACLAGAAAALAIER